MRTKYTMGNYAVGEYGTFRLCDNPVDLFDYFPLDEYISIVEVEHEGSCFNDGIDIGQGTVSRVMTLNELRAYLRAGKWKGCGGMKASFNIWYGTCEKELLKYDKIYKSA